MVIKNDAQYREYKNTMETIIAKGTQLGDMELLPQSDKNEFSALPMRSMNGRQPIIHCPVKYPR